MSIIQEALRKAQGLRDGTKIPEPHAEDVPPPVSPKDNAVHKPPVVLLSVRNVKIALASIAAVLAIFVIRQMFTSGTIRVATRKAAPSRQEIVYKLVPPKEETKTSGSVIDKAVSSFPKPESFGLKPAAPDLVLNGIMYLPDGAQAIINDSVVIEGDTVGGATVRKIERNRVILDYDRIEITLNLKAT